MKELNVITKGKETRKDKSVLLFSGGMDSVMFDLLLNPDILLYIPTGSNYEIIETDKINFVCIVRSKSMFYKHI